MKSFREIKQRSLLWLAKVTRGRICFTSTPDDKGWIVYRTCLARDGHRYMKRLFKI